MMAVRHQTAATRTQFCNQLVGHSRVHADNNWYLKPKHDLFRTPVPKLNQSISTFISLSNPISNKALFMSWLVMTVWLILGTQTTRWKLAQDCVYIYIYIYIYIYYIIHLYQIMLNWDHSLSQRPSEPKRSLVLKFCLFNYDLSVTKRHKMSLYKKDCHWT